MTSKPIISEMEARRLLKKGTITLDVKHPLWPGEVLTIEGMVEGRFEGWIPSTDAFTYMRWGDFEVVNVNFIVFEEGMSAEEAQERIDLLKSIEPPKH